MNKFSLIFASVFMLVSIVMGALGAHTFKDILTEQEMTSFKTATLFLATQSIGLFILEIIANTLKMPIKLSSKLLIWGAFLFSFSIYFLLLAKHNNAELLTKFLGPITPIGGVLMIAAWFIFTLKLIKIRTKAQ